MSLLVEKKNEYYMQMTRILIAVLAGIVAGILRVEGIANGVLLFVLANLVGSLILVFLHRDDKTTCNFFVSNFFGGALSFILMWTLVYDVIHIY